MIYSKIEIRPDSTGRKWQLSFTSDMEDRVRSKIMVFANLGFMYYPASWSKERAFEKLKIEMIKRHEGRIRELNRSLKKLKETKIK